MNAYKIRIEIKQGYDICREAYRRFIKALDCEKLDVPRVDLEFGLFQAGTLDAVVLSSQKASDKTRIDNVCAALVRYIGKDLVSAVKPVQQNPV